jgi:parallel beta-helix repeat protein
MYTEHNIAVNKDATLIGAQANVDPRNGARAWDDAGESKVDANNAGDGFVVTVDNVVINGFAVINASTGGTIDTAHPGRGIFIVESSDCEVKYNVLYNNTWRGIRIWSDTGDAANNEVHHNLCYTDDSSVNGRAGISISGPNTHHNTIEYNECHHCDGGIVPSADAHDNTIRYNNCHDCQRGISLNWGANNNTVEYNTITNNSEGGISLSAPGGGWGAAHHNIVVYNTVTGCGGPDDSGGHGIGLSTDCHDNLIENNTITNSGDFGINLHQAIDNIIRGNTVNNSGRIGISLWDSCTGNVIEGNSIDGTRRHQGIKVACWQAACKCDNNIVRDNEVQNATSHGIFVVYATNTTIAGNTVHGNGGDGIKIGNTSALECSATTTVNWNSIYNNTGYGVNNHHYDGGVPPVLDAILNWWGSADGPTHAANPAGDGDAVSDYVLYSPWLGIDPDGNPATPGPVGPEPTAGYLNAAIAGANSTYLPGTDTIEVRHGTYDASEPITDGVNIVSETGSASHTTLNGNMSINGNGVLIGLPLQGFRVNGNLTVGAGANAATSRINWCDFYGLMTNNGTGTFDARYNYWGTKEMSVIQARTTGAIRIQPYLPKGADESYIDIVAILNAGAAPNLTAGIHQLWRMDRMGLDVGTFIQYQGVAGAGALRATAPGAQINLGGAAGGGGAVEGVISGTYSPGDPIDGRFTLTDPVTGEPITDAAVTLSLLGPDGSNGLAFWGCASYDETTGEYVFSIDTSGLAPGTYELIIQTDDGQSRMVSIEIQAV